MSANQVKSLIAGGFLIFLMLVVFRGEIVRRTYYGVVSRRYGVTYCHNVEGVPALGDIPCYIFDWIVTLVIIAIFFTTVLLVIAIARKFSR